MIITYFQQYRTALLHGSINVSGFICPYKKGDCEHMDSLSMTRTVNCNDCGINRIGYKHDNQLNKSECISNKN
ncbi:MAG TPA: hypothetical protein VIL99_16540 [Ignavibacteria bacterium]